MASWVHSTHSWLLVPLFGSVFGHPELFPDFPSGSPPFVDWIPKLQLLFLPVAVGVDPVILDSATDLPFSWDGEDTTAVGSTTDASGVVAYIQPEVQEALMEALNAVNPDLGLEIELYGGQQAQLACDLLNHHPQQQQLVPPAGSRHECQQRRPRAVTTSRSHLGSGNDDDYDDCEDEQQMRKAMANSRKQARHAPVASLFGGRGPSSGWCEAGPSYAGRRQSRPDTQQVCEPALIGYLVIFIEVFKCRLVFIN